MNRLTWVIQVYNKICSLTATVWQKWQNYRTYENRSRKRHVCEPRTTPLTINDFENKRNSRSKRMHKTSRSLERLENSLTLTHWFNPVKCRDHPNDLKNSNIMNVYCLKPLSLWSFVIAVIENLHRSTWPKLILDNIYW